MMEKKPEPGLLLSESLRWVKLGVPTIPISVYFDNEKEKWVKRPIVNTYTAWRDRPMTVEECKALPWSKANGVMLLTGIKTEQGYFFAIDVDIPIEELRPSLGLFRVTYFEETISNRLHALYWSKAPVPTLTAHDDRNRELRLLGAGAQVVVAPSYGYKKLNDNPLSVIDDPLTYFSEICGKLDFRLDKEKTIEQIEPPSRLKKLLNKIVSRLKVENIGGQYISVHCPFHPPDDHPSFAIHRQKNYAIDYHDGRVYNLKELAEALGIKLEDGEKLVKISAPITIDGARYEEIEEGLLKIANGEVTIGEMIDNYVRDPWLEGVVTLPPAPDEVDSAELWGRVRDYIRRYIYHEDKRIYEVLTAFAFWTYFYDKNPWTCYLFILGPYGSGKTRVLEVLSRLCYRAVHSSILRGPSLFRTIEKMGSLTLLIDKRHGYEWHEDVLDLLTTGYRNNGVVIRSETTRDGIKLKKFRTYCAKVIASADEASEDIMQRCVRIMMMRAPSPPPKRLDDDGARMIRAGLLYLRLNNNVEISGEEYRSIYGDARAEEIYSPLGAMAKMFNPDAVEIINSYFRDEEQLRADELRSSDAALILSALSVIIEETPNDAPEFISTGQIVNALNNSITPQRVGRIMKSFGFKPKSNGRERGYIIDLNLLGRWMDIYRLRP
ncbi:MAG: bifunctional DNA primase/polymerase [Nitrososphaerota archaeon]